MPFFSKCKRSKDGALKNTSDKTKQNISTVFPADCKDSENMKEVNTFQMVEFPDVTDGKRMNRQNEGYQMGRPALVRKGGQYRISYKGLGSKGKHFLLDFYQSLIDMKWRWVILFVFGVFIFVYLMFAVLWYVLGLAHGDFDTVNVNDPNWKPCVVNMRNFADALLFSIESQTTIGYGTLWPDTKCAATLPLVYVQVTVGFMVETILLGFLLVKIARPKHRRNTLLYSSVATICKEDGQLNLQVRIGDMRQSHLVDCVVYGIFIKDKVSEEGVHYPLFQHHMDFHAHGMDDRVFLIWPLVLNHKIDTDSPLYGMKPEEILHANNFEIVVVLEGTIEATGEICQARTSFTSKDILWGYRFSNIVEFDHEHGKWRANFSLFDDVIPNPTPKCSAEQFQALYSGTGNLDMAGDCGRPYLRKAYSHKEPLNEGAGKAGERESGLMSELKKTLAENRF